MAFLVTGAAGLIGRNIALELQDKGKVLALDDFSVGTKNNLEGFKGEIITADIRAVDYSKFANSLEAIFHEAAITDTTVTDTSLMDSVNVDAFKRLLDYARRIGCRKIVYASSAATYGKGKVPMSESDKPAPANIYGESKVKMEAVAGEFASENPGFSVVGLRYFNVYGPGEFHKKKAASMIYQLYLQIEADKNPRIFKWGEQFRDFIYVKDVVAANLRAMDYAKSGVFNVGAGIPNTFNRVIEVLNKVMGKNLKPEYFDNPYGFYQDQTQADTKLSVSELKFKAEYDLEKGIRDYVRILEKT
ncbi:MAG: ADP-glyceromanno-heptose 6-epimerase [Candidatus Omnitrophota bacterium]|nr:ADP-glyceromanno-heptose 6-epimerase [Candidatus Omnitrophota bacterium]